MIDEHGIVFLNVAENIMLNNLTKHRGKTFYEKAVQSILFCLVIKAKTVTGLGRDIAPHSFAATKD